MKRLIYSLLLICTATLLFATQVSANYWVINSYRLEIVSAPTITLVGTNNNATDTGNNLVVTMPGGVVQNDVVYVFTCADTSASDLNMAVTTAGYLELVDIFQTDSNAANMGVYRKVQGASPDTSITITGTANSGQGLAGIIFVLRGVNTTTPEDTADVTATAPSFAVPDPPAITTVTAHAWVLASGCSTEPDVPTVPSGYSNLVEVQSIGGGRPAGVMVARREITSPGAENPSAFGGISGDTNDSWAAASVAVRPQ